MINIEEFTFLSSDGQTRLHAMLWLPEGEIRGILQIAHGVAEHVARYDGFARYLCARGIAVAGHDHLGHGKSLPDGATPVYFGAQDGWQHAVDDIHALHQRLQEEFPNMPLCIMGHSMGSFLTRSYLIRYPGTVRAAVIMGTGWQPAPVIAAGRTRDESASYHAWGHSIVCDPWGSVISACGAEETVAVTELDFARIDAVRHQLPILSARRTDLYQISAK